MIIQGRLMFNSPIIGSREKTVFTSGPFKRLTVLERYTGLIRRFGQECQGFCDLDSYQPYAGFNFQLTVYASEFSCIKINYKALN